jgi:hypothetical protein
VTTSFAWQEGQDTLPNGALIYRFHVNKKSLSHCGHFISSPSNEPVGKALLASENGVFGAFEVKHRY